jgi:nucleoside 2-deoxyribosyltransferase
MKVYLAGPLFTAAELDFNRKLRDLLENAGHKVWLPQEHTAAVPRKAEVVFQQLLTAIDEADAVVANMDGSDPDSGTCWECGFAYARGKPVIAFRTDIRSRTDTGFGQYNLMMWASATVRLDGPFETTFDLAAALLQAFDRDFLEVKGSKAPVFGT